MSNENKIKYHKETTWEYDKEGNKVKETIVSWEAPPTSVSCLGETEHE